MGTVFLHGSKIRHCVTALTTLIHDLRSKVHKLKKCLLPPVIVYVTALAKQVKQTFIN